MGSAKEQGVLWGARARDWAAANEPAWQDIFATVMARAGVGPGLRLLDIGCGVGGAMAVAQARGAIVIGLDASPALVDIARRRLPAAEIAVGEMEDLPFAGASFDIVTALNSFQFASNIVTAISEARRMLRSGGTLAMMSWGRREDCDLLSRVMPAVATLLPSPPAGAPKPLALSEPGVIEDLMRQAGLETRDSGDFAGTLEFPNLDTAVRAVMAAAARAIANVGEIAVRSAVTDALRPALADDGKVRLGNRFRLVLAASA